MVLHSIQTLHAECQMGSVRTVGLRVSQSFFPFRRSELAVAFLQLINETKPLQGNSWKLSGQLSDTARCVFCLFATRVDLAIAASL